MTIPYVLKSAYLGLRSSTRMVALRSTGLIFESRLWILIYVDARLIS